MTRRNVKRQSVRVHSNMGRVVTLSLVLIACALPGRAQSAVGQVYPVPIRGGDLFPPTFITLFSPGFEGLNAEPHGITNFRGIVAMGYTKGTATDNAGHVYNIRTDIRVYQGDYVGATVSGGGGPSVSAKAHGTFVEI